MYCCIEASVGWLVGILAVTRDREVTSESEGILSRGAKLLLHFVVQKDPNVTKGSDRVLRSREIDFL
jgi:hypothetical protein